MKKWLELVLLMLLMVFITGGWGKKENQFDIVDYMFGFQAIDLQDEDSYAQDGKKMVQLINIFMESPEDYTCMVEQKSEFLGGIYFKNTVNSTDASYYYYGKLKKEKPNGFGMLVDKSSEKIIYVGNFKKGKIQGYGMVFGYGGEIPYIIYEGKISKVTKEIEVEPADGSAWIPYGYETLIDAYYQEISEYTGDLAQDMLAGLEESAWIFKCVPKYIGEIKKGEYSGKGTLYDEHGNIQYEGSFKKGDYSGKGTLYYENGSVCYTGNFKNGKYHGKGTLYEEDGSVRYKGEFKNGDVK